MSHFVIDMPSPCIFPPTEDNFLQETLVPHFQARQTNTVSMTHVTKECFDMFLGAYPQPLATPAMLDHRKQQMKSRIYKVIKSRNPGEVNKRRPKVEEVVKPKRKRARNALEQYMVLRCKNNPEFEKQLDIERANIPDTSRGKGMANDHSGPGRGADGLPIDGDSSQPPQKSHKKVLNGLSVQVHRQVAQRLFDLEPCKVQEEMRRLYEQESQEIKEYRSRDPSHVDTKRVAQYVVYDFWISSTNTVLSIISDLRALMCQIEDLLGMIGWSFSFVAGGLEPDNDVPRTFVMNYGWNDAGQDFHDFHPDFESDVVQIYHEFLDTIYTRAGRLTVFLAEERRKKFQEALQACRPKAQTEEESQVKEDGADKPLSAEALAEEEAVLGAFADIFGPLSDYQGDNETSIHGDPDVQQMVATAIASAAIDSEASAGQPAVISSATVSPIQLQRATTARSNNGLPPANPVASFIVSPVTAPIFPNPPCFSDQSDLVLPPFGEASEGTGDPNNNPLPTGGALETSSLFDIDFFWGSLDVPLGEELDTRCIPPDMWSEQWNPASLLPRTSEVNTDDLDLSFMINDDASLFLPDGNHPADADDLNTVLDAGIALFDQNPTAELPNGAIFFSTPQPDDDTSILGQSDSGYAVIPAPLKELNGPAQTFSAQEPGGDIDKPTTTRTLQKPSTAVVLSNDDVEDVGDIEPPEEGSTRPRRAPMQKEVSFDTEAAEIVLCSLNLGASFVACVDLWKSFEQCVTVHVPVTRQTTQAGALPMANYSCDLGDMRKKGGRGMLQIMYAMRWWGTFQLEREKWETFVQDVSSCLKAMLEGSGQRNQKASPAASLRKRKR
ncbi:hypothetical protein ARMSODRAFT_979208 [Armillaria solidipes]|uniref:Uncharacterized protein n=1 Tax=Armillaria solidipes TaxID=1076256 RepID=A0A2H3B694_9AGAR|nr:hypothetical protein ARMSODRAFT_979208 [Armillaria solidipes]